MAIRVPPEGRGSVAASECDVDGPLLLSEGEPEGASVPLPVPAPLSPARRRLAVAVAGLCCCLATVAVLRRACGLESSEAPGFLESDDDSFEEDARTRIDEEELEELYGGSCQDTPGWTNGWTGCAYSEVGKDPSLCALTPGGSWPSTAGYTCKFYQTKGLCANGQYKGFAMGPGLNSPEKNCCACKGFKVRAQCPKDTGGGCRWTGKCNGWRGPATCSNGKCMCKPGYCVSAGGTCHQNSRAMAVRQAKHIATGPMQCSTQTSGKCFMGGCDFWRGATKCEMFKCMCQIGHCVDEFGGCYKAMGTIRAEVIPISSAQPRFPGPPVKTAIAVSGGGSRALSAALGTYRALRDLGLIENIDLISSVSGGSWASSILMFAPMELPTLLGKETTPSELTLARLDQAPPPLGAVVMTKINEVALKLKLSGVPFGMLWVASVAKAFLEPFGLNRFDAYLAPSQAAVAQIKQKNPQFQNAAFTVPQPGRAKNIVMNSAVLGPASYSADANNVVSFQVGPDYAGSPFYPDDQTVKYNSANIGDPPLPHVLIGGGMVSTYAFGSSEPTKRGVNGQKGGNNVQVQSGIRPMSLARAVGMSSAAFGGQMSYIPGLGADMNPRVEVWPVTSDAHPRPEKAMRHEIGDGGNLENTGLLSALQRGATNIVSLINGAGSISMSPNFCDSFRSTPTGKEITGQFSNLFGFDLVSDSMQEFHKYNQVFEKTAYVPTMCELQKLKAAGKPLTLRTKLNVINNKWWGIQARQVDIIFCILDKSELFEKLLPAETQQAIAAGAAGGLEGFPGYKTMFQNAPDLTSLTARQINLLSSQTEFAVKQNAFAFSAVLGPSKTWR